MLSNRPAPRRLLPFLLGCLAAVPLMLAGAPARADEFTAAQKSELGPIIRDYLVQNPEVLRDAMVELDKRDKAQESAKRDAAMQENASLLNDSPYGEVIGNPQGKAVLVEFFDYNCGYCKRALDDLSNLMKSEPELKVVLKDFPVLGPGSVEAAQVAGAVRMQLKGDKFWAFHQRLLSSHGPVGKAQALAVAKESGVDMDQLAKDVVKPDVKAGIEQNLHLAEVLNLTGTPSYVVGSDVVVGAVGYAELKTRVDNVLKCGKAMCS